MLTGPIREWRSGAGVLEHLGPAYSGLLGDPDSNRDCRDRNSGRPTVRPAPKLVEPIAGPLPFPSGDRGSGPFVILAPAPSACRRGALSLVTTIFLLRTVLAPLPLDVKTGKR